VHWPADELREWSSCLFVFAGEAWSSRMSMVTAATSAYCQAVSAAHHHLLLRIRDEMGLGYACLWGCCMRRISVSRQTVPVHVRDEKKLHAARFVRLDRIFFFRFLSLVSGESESIFFFFRSP
jgi:hypothetical protein